MSGITALLKAIKPKKVDLVKNKNIVKEEETLANLPTLEEDFIRLFRASSPDPEMRFEEVFDVKKLKGYDPKEKKGEFYTQDLNYADYFRETYGKDASISYIDIPKKYADDYRLNEIEFVVDLPDLEKKIKATGSNKPKEELKPKGELKPIDGDMDWISELDTVKPKGELKSLPKEDILNEIFGDFDNL